SVAGLIVNTENTTVRVPGVYVPDTTVTLPYTSMGAFRIKQDILAESQVGLLATYGDQQDRNNSWSAGSDFTYQTSSLMDDKNLLIGAWGMAMNREGQFGDKTAYGARIDFPNDLVDATVAVTRIGDGFDPSLGFVPRKGVQIFTAGSEINPRPGWPGVRQLFHEVSFARWVNRRSDRWESYQVTVKPFDWLLESGDRATIQFEPQGDRLNNQFEVYPDIDIAPGSYEWTRNIFSLTSAPKRRLSGELRLENGGEYTGYLKTPAGGATLQPAPPFPPPVPGGGHKTTGPAAQKKTVPRVTPTVPPDTPAQR